MSNFDDLCAPIGDALQRRQQGMLMFSASGRMESPCILWDRQYHVHECVAVAYPRLCRGLQSVLTTVREPVELGLLAPEKSISVFVTCDLFGTMKTKGSRVYSDAVGK